MSVATYTVTGMTCAHCENAVRDEVALVDGVTEVQVSADTGLLTVTATGELDDARILGAVDEAGYAAVPRRP